MPQHLPLVPFPSQCDELGGTVPLAAGCQAQGVPAGLAATVERELRAALRTAPAVGISTISFTADTTQALGDEGYTLAITSNAVQAVAAGDAGLCHAAHTLRQLLAAFGHRLPALCIRDTPRFAWRGVHLDVSRHFFSVETVLRLIDLAALHKLNRFHWHLTDDQGWRIEIPSLPKLTTVGAWRAGSKRGHHNDAAAGFDTVPHGGFYTQAEIRRVVQHAASLGIAVLPEIDMPGHMQAAIAAYPELGNRLHPAAVRQNWGISTQVLNCEPAAFAFVEQVLENVLNLFPAPWVHVGGDEVPTDEWQASPQAQARMRSLGLANTDALQHHWTLHLAAWLRARGRRLIGWDEIHERSGAGLPSDAVVMAWRSEGAAVAAAHAGHAVIMAPGQWTYLDHYQVAEAERSREPLAIGGALTLERCATWEPIPTALQGSSAATQVWGGQAQLWTEYIGTPQHLDFMAWPRLSALAEALWSQPAARTAQPFMQRVSGHCRLLDRLGVAYRPLGEAQASA